MFLSELILELLDLILRLMGMQGFHRWDSLELRIFSLVFERHGDLFIHGGR